MKWFNKSNTKVGILLVIISILGFAYIFTQCKININKVRDIEVIEHFNKIGIETAKELIQNAPYESIDDIDKIDGIGTVKQEVIHQKFTVKDTLRYECFLSALIICSLINIIGVLTIAYCVLKKEKFRSDLLNKLNEVFKKE